MELITNVGDVAVRCKWITSPQKSVIEFYQSSEFVLLGSHSINSFFSSRLGYEPDYHYPFVIGLVGKYVVTPRIGKIKITSCAGSLESVTIIEWVSVVRLEAINLLISLMVTSFKRACILVKLKVVTLVDKQNYNITNDGFHLISAIDFVYRLA